MPEDTACTHIIAEGRETGKREEQGGRWPATVVERKPKRVCEVFGLGIGSYAVRMPPGFGQQRLLDRTRPMSSWC